MKKALTLVLWSLLLGSNAHALEVLGRITDPRTDRVSMSALLEATNKIPFCAEFNIRFQFDLLRWEPKVKILRLEPHLDANRRYSFDAREAIQEATSGPAALCRYQLKHIYLTLEGRYGERNDTVRSISLRPDPEGARVQSIPVPRYNHWEDPSHKMDFDLDSSIEVNITPTVYQNR